VPLAIPEIKWSSAPPPIAPRSFSTPPPPPPSSPTLVTEPPPPAPHREQLVSDDEEEEPTRIQPEDIRRAVEIREETRLLIRETLEEALAPLHYAVRTLERRLDAIEASNRRSQDHIAAPQPPAAAPPQTLSRAIPPPAVAAATYDPRDPFGSVVAASEVVTIPPAPRAPALDWDAGPFDGARRKRRIVMLFALMVVIVFGALFGALIWSRVG
jgi:hypothetical protein